MYIAYWLPLTFGYPQHLVDDVDASYTLGDWVLDLKTRVHLQEIEVFVGIDQELHST